MKPLIAKTLLILQIFLFAACSESNDNGGVAKPASDAVNQVGATNSAEQTIARKETEEIEQSLISSIEQIAGKQARRLEEVSVNQLEKLSEADRQALQALVAETTMQAAERKALEQAKSQEHKKAAQLAD